MKHLRNLLLTIILVLLIQTIVVAQDDIESNDSYNVTLYDIPPRWLVDMPTAGTLPRGHYDIGVRIFPNGGGLGFTNIGISSRITLGISYGGEQIVSNQEPNWNGRIGFNLKLRLVDELEYFPAITIGYTDQGYGKWNSAADRYTFKSRGFYAVVSRSIYFYKWTAGWHAGLNKSREDENEANMFVKDNDINFFAGFDATFDYNLGLVFEYDAALNDDSDANSPLSGKGRGYFNSSIKWLFAQNLELELVLKDLFVNRREADTFTREVRMTYIDRF